MRFTFSFTKYLQDELFLKTCLLHSLLELSYSRWVKLLTKNSMAFQIKQTYLFSLSLIGKWGRFSNAQCEGYEGSPGASSIQPDFSEEGRYSVVGWSLWFKYWVSLILWGFLCLHGVKLSWDNIYEPIHKMVLCFSRQGEKHFIKINALLLQLNLTLDKWNESSNI